MMMTNTDIHKGLIQKINAEDAWRYRIIPVEENSKQVIFLTDEEAIPEEFLTDLEIKTGKEIIIRLYSTEQIQRNLKKYYTIKNTKTIDETDISRGAGILLKNLISEALKTCSSDIHIETYEDRCRIRIRIDGILVEKYNILKSAYPALINMVKIRSGLDIAEKRLPQEGRIHFQESEIRADIRVSVMPSLHGEKTVLRLLNRDISGLDLRTLGFSADQLQQYLSQIKKPHGIILISGPTGSGKTTTLYATLKEINNSKKNILTIEDPVEYTMEGINQVQLRESIGLTFSSALKSFLRQDPDIIMIGEIRDSETAQLAIRAAMTGHLVLSTIHTSSAWGTIDRLMDMGIPPFLIAGTLNASIAQRLVRILCKKCRTKREKQQNEPANYPQILYEETGCQHCRNTGFTHRKAIYEVISFDTYFSQLIRTHPTEIHHILKKHGIATLAERAMELLHEGETTPEEIASLTSMY